MDADALADYEADVTRNQHDTSLSGRQWPNYQRVYKTVSP